LPEHGRESWACLFREGDSSEFLYVVAAGRIKMLKHSSRGKDFIVDFFGPGEMVGEVAVFEDRPYPASAEVADSCKFGDTTLISALNSHFPWAAHRALS